MNHVEATNALRLNNPMLLVCDVGGTVQAISSGSSNSGIFDTGGTHKHFSELFGRDSSLTQWLTEQISEARRRDTFHAESKMRNGAEPLLIRLESLKRDGELYGFALQIFPGEATGEHHDMEEGDAVVTRKHWHEIKNHIGAQKLYATLLRKSLKPSDERDTVEKMLMSMNQLIDYIEKIRRGEAQ